MKSQSLLATMALAAPILVLTAQPASAMDAYGRVFAGAGDVGVGPFTVSGDELGAALGVDDLGPFRVEGSATHFDGGFGGLSATAWDFGATAFIDIPLGNRLTISPNVGIDYATIDFGPFSTNENGWHWGIEGSTPIKDNLDLTAGFTRTYLDFGGGFDAEVDSLQVGVRFDL